MERTDFEQWKAKEVSRLLALVETERRYYQEMVAALPIPLLVLNAHGSVLSANRAFRLTFSFRSDDLRNKSIQHLLPSDALAAAIQAAHESGPQPAVFVETGGRHLRVAVIPIRNWDDENELETLLMVEDLSALDALRGATPSAPPPVQPVATQPHLQPAPIAPTPPVPLPAADIPAILWQADAASLSFIELSGASDGLFGYPLAHWREKPGFFAERIHPDDRNATLDFFRDAVRRGGDATAEFRVRALDGSTRWCRETIRVSESRFRINGISTDITRRRALEEQLLTAQRAEALQDFSARLAHDLNNPLMIATGYSEDLLHSVAPEDPKRGDVEQIVSATSRLAGIGTQLLNFTRHYALPPQAVNLSRTFREMQDHISDAAGRGIHIDCAAGGETVWALAHPRQLEEIVLALVSHRREDARDRTRIVVHCDIDLLTEQTPHATLSPGVYSRISIHDNGRGVDPQGQAQVFEMFVARDPEAAAGPSIARAYSIVRDWGGDLTFASAPFQGSTFTLYLPHCEPQQEEPEPHTVDVTAQEHAPDLPPPPAILVVEDEAGIRALVRKILKREGYQVLEAGSAEEALSIASAHGKIALLVSDVMLPGIGGRDLAEKLLAIAPGVKVLYISGYTDDEDVLAAKFPPGAHFLQKPFTLSALVGKVRESLES